MNKVLGFHWAMIAVGAMLLSLAAACGAEPEIVEVEKEVVVEKEVPVEIIVEKEVEVIKEVVTEVEKEVVVVREVVATPAPVSPSLALEAKKYGGDLRVVSPGQYQEFGRQLHRCVRQRGCVIELSGGPVRPRRELRSEGPVGGQLGSVKGRPDLHAHAA